MTSRIGFIGLGRMGLPMSYRLLNDGFNLPVHNRSQEKVKQISDVYAHAATSMAQITQATDILLTCFPDIAAAEELFLGQDGIIENCEPGQVLVDHSTVGARTSKTCAEAAARKAYVFLYAPISGGSERALDGTLTIMAGGSKEAYDLAFKLFKQASE